ncbi:MAG: TnsA endonuclease N-terminal domain-containing protein [Ferruginibacter sp.]
MSKHVYSKSYPFTYWGCHFDSLTELKYAISIAGDYEFLRAAIPIYFNPKTKQTTDYIREGIRRYTPDFLIRHKITGKAFLIEIKPENFSDAAELDLRSSIAEHYIKRKELDWTFKIIYSSQINLSRKNLEHFEQCCNFRLKRHLDRNFTNWDIKFDSTATPLFSGPRNGNVQFIMFGKREREKNNFSLL